MAQKGKFDGVIFDNHTFTEVTPQLFLEIGGGFRCTRGEFATYWKKNKIKGEADALISKCWIITHNNHLAAYITLLADKLTLDVPILKAKGISYKTFPAVKIGWLAADERAKGAGRRIVECAIFYIASELMTRLGVRFITVDAFYDSDASPHYDISGFYEKIGFRFVNAEEALPPKDNFRTMYMDLMPLYQLLNEENNKKP